MMSGRQAESYKIVKIIGEYNFVRYVLKQLFSSVLVSSIDIYYIHNFSPAQVSLSNIT